MLEGVQAPSADQPAWRGRLYDMAALVAAHDPSLPPPWIIQPLAIRGTLAIVAGKGGAGKTWVVHEAANAVQQGSEAAGLRGTKGSALIIDAEMGQWLTVDRFARQGYSTDTQVFDAQGLDLRSDADRQLIRDAVLDLRPDFVGFDSLKALTPSGKEDSSDDMGPAVNWLRWLVDKAQAAGVLVHHAGWKEDRTRGSSAIKDRVDAVWYLSSTEERGEPQKLSCRGADLKAPRWCRPPDDLWLCIGDGGGLGGSGAPAHPADQKLSRVLDSIRTAQPPLDSANAVAAAAGVDKNGMAKYLAHLVEEGQLEKDGKRFLVNADHAPPRI